MISGPSVADTLRPAGEGAARKERPIAAASGNSARYVSSELAGWGNFPRAHCRLFRPESAAALRRVVADGDAGSIIPRGLGRSYGDAATNDGGGVVLQERLDRLLGFDEETGTLHAEGGASLADILGVFVPRGWFVPVTPGTKFVTLGGAIAADVHGKNHHRDGCFSSFVDEFTLLTASGRILACSRRENADVFRATVGGMGLTGVVLSAALRLRRIETAYCEVEYTRAENIDRALEVFLDDSRHTYSVAWIDCLAGGPSLGRSVVMRGEHAPRDRLPPRLRETPLRPRLPRERTIPALTPGWLLNPLSVRAFNTLFYHRPRRRHLLMDYDRWFYPLDRLMHWNRLYGRRGFTQYQAVLPADAGRQGMIDLLEALSKSGLGSFLAVLKTLGPENEGLLSFPMAGHTLALDIPNTGGSLRDLVARLDQIVLRHGGRVYLAKDALLQPADFRRMYPRAEEFADIVARLDPAGRFESGLSRRLGMTGRRAGGAG